MPFERKLNMVEIEYKNYEVVNDVGLGDTAMMLESVICLTPIEILYDHHRFHAL